MGIAIDRPFLQSSSSIVGGNGTRSNRRRPSSPPRLPQRYYRIPLTMLVLTDSTPLPPGVAPFLNACPFFHSLLTQRLFNSCRQENALPPVRIYRLPHRRHPDGASSELAQAGGRGGEDFSPHAPAICDRDGPEFCGFGTPAGADRARRPGRLGNHPPSPRGAPRGSSGV